jgi:ADP-ribosylation factor-like protein 2
MEAASISDVEGNSGLDSAGKTTITKKLLGEPIDDISPTLGFQIRTINVDGYSSSPRPFSGVAS